MADPAAFLLCFWKYVDLSLLIYVMATTNNYTVIKICAYVWGVSVEVVQFSPPPSKFTLDCLIAAE